MSQKLEQVQPIENQVKHSPHLNRDEGEGAAIDSQHYWGCPCCDLLVEKVTLNKTLKASCPRCGYTLGHPIAHSIEKTLAISIAALILFFPAMLMPIMSMNILGNVSSQTIVESVVAVFNDGHFFVAILVFLSCVFVPLLKISILAYVSSALYFNQLLPSVRLVFRMYKHIDEWGMLEIYMLAIIVSIIKLAAMSQLSFNLGMLVFTCLLVLSLLSSVFLDEEQFWDKIEKLHLANQTKSATS